MIALWIWIVWLYRVLLRAIYGFSRNDGAALAGYMAYTGLLAFFPFLIFSTMLIGYVIGQDGIEPTMAFLFDAMPYHVAETLRPAVQDVLANTSFQMASLSAVAAVYVASNGFEALRIALDRAYGLVGERHFLISRLVSIGFTFAGVAAFGLICSYIIIFPTLNALMPDLPFFHPNPSVVTRWSRFLVGALLMVAFLAALHTLLPARRPEGPVMPGVIVTAVLWIALASLFSVYFQFAPSYTVTYGTLAGVIVCLLFFYLTGAIFIFGAEINAALDPAHTRPSKSVEHAPLL